MTDLPNQEQPNPVPQQEPELGGRARADETDRAKELARQAKRWGIVNAALCGLLVVAFVASVLLGLGVIEADGSGQGIFAAAMLIFFIPIACIPIGISCLIGALRARAVLRRHPSREARLGLRLSVGGPIAVILCYVLGLGIPFLFMVLSEPALLFDTKGGASSESVPRVDVKEVRLTDRSAEASAPAWSPDGSRIAFDRYDGVDLPHIYVMDADGSNMLQLTDYRSRNPAWSPDGSHIAFEGHSKGGPPQVYVMDADGSNMMRLTARPAKSPAWSPDGSRIAFVAYGQDERWQIYVMDADGSNVMRLTHGSAERGNPAWSPDGSRIAFDGGDNLGYGVHVMDADGSNVVRLTDRPEAVSHPAWSPDGSRIAFDSRGQDARWHIYMMDADGANVVRLTDGPAVDPSWSPDGSRIAYRSGRSVVSGRVVSDIYVLEFKE